MNWEEERYVRVFTRDTAEDMMLPWDAMALWWALLRKFDRSGVLVLGKAGVEGLVAMTRIPLDVIERVLPLLLKDGRIVLVEGRIVAPNFIAAQETRQSDAARQRDSRERRRAHAMRPSAGDPPVPVTSGHQSSPGVTPYHAVPSHAVLSLAGSRTGDPSLVQTNPGSAGATPDGAASSSIIDPPMPVASDPEATSPATSMVTQTESRDGTQPHGTPTASALPASPAGHAQASNAQEPLRIAALDPAHSVKLVWDTYIAGWRRRIGGTRPPRLDDKRRKLISSRLRDFPLDDLLLACAGVWKSEFHVSEGHTGIELVLRDAAHIERFVRTATANSVAYSLWCKTYAESRRKYGTYTPQAGDVNVAERYAMRAADIADAHVEANGTSEKADDLALKLLSYWYRQYLRDDGVKGYLVEAKHPLRLLEKGITNYGKPWDRQESGKPVENVPKNTPTPAAPAAVANMLRDIGSIKTVEPGAIVQRGPQKEMTT